jgi:hypothetical protein
VALISFCRQTTWSALGLDSTLSRPTITDCQDRLISAKGARSAAIEGALAKEVHEKEDQTEPDVLVERGRCSSKKRVIESLGTINQEEEFLGEEASRQLQQELGDSDKPETKRCRVTEVCLSSGWSQS